MSGRRPGGPISSLAEPYIQASVTVQHPILRGRVIHQFEGNSKEMAKWLQELAAYIDLDITP